MGKITQTLDRGTLPRVVTKSYLSTRGKVAFPPFVIISVLMWAWLRLHMTNNYLV